MSKKQGGVPPQLAVCRVTVGNLGVTLVRLLAECLHCTQQVGLLKAQLDLPPVDPGHKQQRVARLRSPAEESGLDLIFAEKFFISIVAEIAQYHREICDDHEAKRAKQAEP